jgi:hypothetical protein
MFLKVFEIPKNFFQKVLWWGAGATPLPDKPQFINNLSQPTVSQNLHPPS